MSAADELLSNAKRSGDADLLRFLVKEVGLVSKSDNMGAAREISSDVTKGWKNIEAAVALSTNSAREGQDIDRFNCADCKATGATRRCSRCKKEHYCSVQCQESSWSEHKVVCERQEERGAESSAAGVGSSNP